MAPRSRPIDRFLEQLGQLAIDVDDLSVATAAHLHLNRTDFRALQILRRSEGLTASELARGLRVTTGATTRVIDSLVDAGHAEREWDPVDRRRIVVRATPAARRALESPGERVRAEARRLVESYRPEDLDALTGLLTEFGNFLRAEARRLSES